MSKRVLPKYVILEKKNSIIEFEILSLITKKSWQSLCEGQNVQFVSVLILIDDIEPFKSAKSHFSS